MPRWKPQGTGHHGWEAVVRWKSLTCVCKPAMDVRSNLGTAAGTPASSCALLRNLGVCVGDFGPYSSVMLKPFLFVPFMDTTMLAASEDELIPLFFPLADFHDG